jgi:hypothetical protein
LARGLKEDLGAGFAKGDFFGEDEFLGRVGFGMIHSCGKPEADMPAAAYGCRF